VGCDDAPPDDSAFDDDPAFDSEPDPEGDLHRTLDLSDPGGGVPAGGGASGACRCGPRVQLYVHLTDAALTGTDPTAIARIEGLGPITAHTLRHWLGGKPHLSVTVRPVTLPEDTPPADSYEIPTRVREALRLRHPASSYPWSAALNHGVDLDHTKPWRPDGPPGQTGLPNLGPLTRSEHRLKTARHTHPRQPAPGIHLWRSRHGWIHLVTPTGTHNLGNTPQAHRIWHAARPTAHPIETASREPGSWENPPRSRLEQHLTDLLWNQTRVMIT
jgi:hypothetical protein